MDLVVPDPDEVDRAGRDRAVEQAALSRAARELKRVAKKRKIRLDVPWAELTDDEKQFVVEGGRRRRRLRRRARILPLARAEEIQGARPRVSQPVPRLPDVPRLRRRAAAARSARRAGRRPHDRSGVGADGAEAQEFFGTLELTEKEAAIADKVLKEIRRRLSFLSDVGLDYLTLDRLSSTLSGGEAQRINLATSLGSALVGTLYVLDEPSIGLHSRDNLRLIEILRQLRDQGNTVLVVEHDADMIKVADHIVDLGLGAGEQGGRVVFSGTLDGLMHEPRSLTSKYLRGELAIPVPTTRRRGTGQKIRCSARASTTSRTSTSRFR